MRPQAVATDHRLAGMTALLERYLVVHFAAVEIGGSFAGAGTHPSAATTTTLAALRVEHGQLAAEVLQHDFGRIFLDPVLVGPFAGLQRALNVNLGALAQVLLGDLRRGSR